MSYTDQLKSDDCCIRYLGLLLNWLENLSAESVLKSCLDKKLKFCCEQKMKTYETFVIWLSVTLSDPSEY